MIEQFFISDNLDASFASKLYEFNQLVNLLNSPNVRERVTNVGFRNCCDRFVDIVGSSTREWKDRNLLNIRTVFESMSRFRERNTIYIESWVQIRNMVRDLSFDYQAEPPPAPSPVPDPQDTPGSPGCSC